MKIPMYLASVWFINSPPDHMMDICDVMEECRVVARFFEIVLQRRGEKLMVTIDCLLRVMTFVTHVLADEM